MSECIRNIVTEHRNKTGVITMHSRGWFPMTRNSLMEHSSLYIRIPCAYVRQHICSPCHMPDRQEAHSWGPSCVFPGEGDYAPGLTDTMSLT